MKLIAFLTLRYHISIQNLVEMFCARRGIMMTHTAGSGPNTFQWYSNVPTPTHHTPSSLLSHRTALTTNFLCFSRGIFLCLHSEQPWLGLNFAKWTFYHLHPSSFCHPTLATVSCERISAETNLSSQWPAVPGQKLCRTADSVTNVDGVISQMQNQWSIQSSIREMK